MSQFIDKEEGASERAVNAAPPIEHPGAATEERPNGPADEVLPAEPTE